MDPIYHYRSTLDHDLLRETFTGRADAIPLDAEFAMLGRETEAIGERRHV